jgi:hypothetical protein
MPTPVENFSTGVFPFCGLIGWTKLKGVSRLPPLFYRRLSRQGSHRATGGFDGIFLTLDTRLCYIESCLRRMLD